MTDIETQDDSNALRAAFNEYSKAAEELDEIAAFRAGWLAGREWARGYAAGYVMGQRSSNQAGPRRVGEYAVWKVEHGHPSISERGLAAGYQAGRE